MVEFSVDRIIETYQDMNRMIGMTLGEMCLPPEVILEVMQECIKIRTLGSRIIEVDIEESIGIRIMKEA